MRVRLRHFEAETVDWLREQAGFGIALPPPVRTVPIGAASVPDFPDVSVEGALSGLGAVTLEPVEACDRG